MRNILNWKKYPSDVFILALPLFVIGMGFCGMTAYLQWRINGTLVYAFILLGGLTLLGIGLWPLRNRNLP